MLWLNMAINSRLEEWEYNNSIITINEIIQKHDVVKTLTYFCTINAICIDN